jgi:hypothetical protein
MTREDLILKCRLSFVSLKELDVNYLPVAMASGCIVKYNQKHFLLTVFHAVGNQQKWALEIRYEHSAGMKMYPVGGFRFLKKGNISTLTFEDVDFALKELDSSVTPFYQEIAQDRSGNILLETPKIINELDFSVKPSPDKKYYFAGLTRPALGQLEQNRFFLEQELTIEEDLAFTGEKEDLFIFKVARPYPGHEKYRGCSGSPIMDNDGNIVALVVEGDLGKNEIYGINLNKYKIVLDIEAGLIR